MEIGDTMQISCLWYDHIYGAVEFLCNYVANL